MEQYGNSKQEWLKQFWELPNGIPSHDTIARVFARIDPLEFEQCFRDWVKTGSQLIPGEIYSDHAPENLAQLRKMSLNLLSQEKTLKIGVANKRLKAAWDNNYLAKVLGI
jgi:hypothetical protein